MSFDYDSPEWEEERAETLWDWNGLCERCGEPTESPHVHHRYGTGVRDYEILCPDCHADHHGDPEIAEYRKPSFSLCKRCGQKIQWNEVQGMMLPCNLKSGLRHLCP